MMKRIVALVFLTAAMLSAAPTPDQLRAATIKHINDGTQTEGIEQFTGYLSKRLTALSRVPTRELGQMAAAADCVQFMQLTQRAQPTPETAAWILASGERLNRVISTIQPEDNLPRCLAIIDELRLHDPSGCDAYFDLILAIAVVLDQADNVRVHGQMGSEVLAYENNAVERYNDYKQLYEKRRAKMEYRKLTAAELRFVVHVPVPDSELEWARENVSGSLSSWDSKYSDIEYDTSRPDAARYKWDLGPYTLASIEENGGICVDQAYFAVMTARAHGIPAIYFHGSGKSANHAWFSYMRAPGDWKLDVGRYTEQGFTTGYAVDPQTRKQMTDHDVAYACESSLHSAASAHASAYTSIAEVLLESDPDNALRCARLARKEVKRFLRPWDIEQTVLADRNDYDGLLELFEQKGDAFRKYPDILVASAKEIEAILSAAGRTEEITKLLRSLNSDMGGDRDDLQRSLETDRIDRLVEAGDVKKACREMERLLDDQKDGGNKTFSLIQKYIELTKKTGQTNEAVKFLEDYIEDLIEYNDFIPDYQKRLLGLLSTAYRNNGDIPEANKVLGEIESL